ncbi:MAG: ABC transporter ATP-binding protein [Chloroflexota bacterium]|nr:ABC transporter ATP-binding protein [Chloroflexota bacterium]
MESVAIRTEELGKRYGKITALAGLTMSIPAGDVFGFLGPNGAGKTTAVKLLLGLARPTSGEGWVLGAPLSDRAAHRRARRGVGYLPELFRYQHWLSAREVLRVHCELIGLDRATWDAEIKDALGLVGLADRADDRVGGYSKGMQQRLGLGVALLGRPALVLLDEPTSALDPVGRHDVREVIRALKDRGTTVFLNSHLLTEVEQVCDRVAIVDKGRVIQVGTLDELLTTDAVRLRATGLENGAHDALRAFGELQAEGEWIVVRGIAADRVPDLVRAIVERGGRVHAVEPRHESLEDRFLSLLDKPHP